MSDISENYFFTFYSRHDWLATKITDATKMLKQHFPGPNKVVTLNTTILSR